MQPEFPKWWCLAIALVASPVVAGADGAELFEVCAVCHGEHGEGNEAFSAPRLTGQHSWYLETQLYNFRSGIRGRHPDDEGGQIMQPMAVALSDDDIASLVEHIEGLDVVVDGDDPMMTDREPEE